MNQQVEYLRLHRYQRAITAQLAKLGIQRVVIEAKFHWVIASFLKKQSSPSHEEIKRQAKFCRRVSVIVLKSEPRPHCPSGSQFYVRSPSYWLRHTDKSNAKIHCICVRRCVLPHIP